MTGGCMNSVYPSQGIRIFLPHDSREVSLSLPCSLEMPPVNLSVGQAYLPCIPCFFCPLYILDEIKAFIWYDSPLPYRFSDLTTSLVFNPRYFKSISSIFLYVFCKYNVFLNIFAYTQILTTFASVRGTYCAQRSCA